MSYPFSYPLSSDSLWHGREFTSPMERVRRCGLSAGLSYFSPLDSPLSRWSRRRGLGKACEKVLYGESSPHAAGRGGGEVLEDEFFHRGAEDSVGENTRELFSFDLSFSDLAKWPSPFQTESSITLSDALFVFHRLLLHSLFSSPTLTLLPLSFLINTCVNLIVNCQWKIVLTTLYRIRIIKKNPFFNQFK